MDFRKTVLPIIISTLIFTTLGLSVDAFAQNPNDQLPSQIKAPDRLIVKFNPGVSEQNQNSILTSNSATVLDHLPLLDVKIISVPEQALDAVKNALSNNNSVEYAEFDLGVPPNTIPNDTIYGNQWYLPMINAPEAYDITHGNGPPIVILDSGIDMDHSDLSSKIIFPYNGLTQVAGPVDHQNGCGHGTPVAGSAAAITNNANGIAGVGWDTQIIPVKITDDNATGGTKCYGWSNGVLKGVEWAVSHNAKVVNLSYGFGASGSILTAAQLLQNNGGWLVISAGNDYGQINKADDPRVIFVSSTTSSDVLSSFSSYGDFVDMSGPGSSILTTSDGNGYGYWSGTSFAAPITAAALNLLYSVDPTLTSTESFDILKNSAADLGTAGWDIQFGHGRVDAYAAVLAASSTTPSPTAVSDAYTTDEETSLAVAVPGVLGNDSDPEDDPITAVLSTGVSNGILNLNSDGSFIYTPNENFDGLDSFTYRATDGPTISNIATVSITVNPVNDAPGADPQSVSTDEDTPLPITLTATDVDGNPLTFSVVSGPSNGSLSGTEPNLVYTPDPGHTGIDSFTFKANDGTVDSNIATISITINAIMEVHLENITGESNGKKRWTATLMITIFDETENPYSGATVLGTWQGGPNDNCIINSQGQCHVSHATKADSQTFTVNNISANGIIYDSAANHVNSSFIIFKDGSTPGNTPPVADSQSVLTTVNISLGITLTASDVDDDPLGFSVVSGPSNGLLSGTEPNLTYTPNSDFEGVDSFTFKANDGTADSNTATISITITPVNAPPVANDDLTSTDEDSSTNVVVLTNDSDPDGDSFSISAFDGTSSQGASISDNGDGTFTYDPTTSSTLQSLNDGQDQDDTFSYTIEDEHGASDSALVTVTVSGSDDAPSTLSITSIYPNSVIRGSTGVVIQVFGTGFSGSSTMSLENGGGPIPTITNTTFQNPGLIEITIDVSSNGPKNTTWDLRANDGGDSAVLSGALNITK